MKKLLAATALIGALVGGAVLLNGGEGELLTAIPVKDVKVKILTGDCPSEKSKDCPAGMMQRKDVCICYTDKKTVDNEVKPDLIAAKDRIRLVLCCNQIDPETKEKHHVVTRSKGTGPIPIGCQVLKSNLVADLSTHNVWTEIDDAAKAACCKDCPGNCWIKPGEHGQCPYCLCDGSCGKYCPEEE